MVENVMNSPLTDPEPLAVLQYHPDGMESHTAYLQNVRAIADAWVSERSDQTGYLVVTGNRSDFASGETGGHFFLVHRGVAIPTSAIICMPLSYANQEADFNRLAHEEYEARRMGHIRPKPTHPDCPHCRCRGAKPKAEVTESDLDQRPRNLIEG